MKIAISSGHGQYIRGARGNPVPPQVDEVDEARRIVDEIAKLWRGMGHDIFVFHDNTSHDQSTNLETITRAHNNSFGGKGHDLDVSVHLNCYDHSAHGVEVLYVTQEALAGKVSAAIAACGFTNRGAKYRSDLYVLNNTIAPAILIETFFCDHTGDCNTYHSRFEDVCSAIAESITGDSVVEPPERPDRPERPPAQISLGGMPLNYLIALSTAGGAEGQVTELGYDAERPPMHGIGVKYVNLRDEKDSGEYAPYLPPDDISEEYGEPAPDPDHDGFWENLGEQLNRASEQGFSLVELDNLDTYSVEVAIDCFEEVHDRGLGVLVKNPAIVEGDPAELLRHVAAAMVVVEQDCGAPAAMEALRKKAAKQLPVRFVSYGDGRAWAEEMAAAIRGGGYVDMAVSYSAHGEYGSSEQILPPTTGQEPPDHPPPLNPNPPPSESSRPTIRKGDEGYHVSTVQTCLLPADQVDGDFGSITEGAVIDYQRRRHLEADGIVGPATWGALEDEFNLSPYPPPVVPPLADRTISKVCEIAERSAIAGYNWDDRGEAPIGYTKGIAVAYAYAYKKLYLRDPAAIEMAKANTGNESTDALAWYAGVFNDLGMSNEEPGYDTLRHLFVMLMGLGMRESSGQHCCGRDQSASNTDAMTCEAGAWQSSWNLSSCSDLIPLLMDQYADQPPMCVLDIWSDDVSCSSSDWKCYGSGTGYDYQELAKNCPTFAAEMTAIGLRNLRQHWGPVNRFEVEIRPEADNMFKQVAAYLATLVRQHEAERVS